MLGRFLTSTFAFNLLKGEHCRILPYFLPRARVTSVGKSKTLSLPIFAPNQFPFTTAVMSNSQFIIPNDVPIVNLECSTAFNGLTAKEKLYAHYLTRASWAGGLICLFQTSPESPGIFLLLQKLFKAETVEELKQRSMKAVEGLVENEFQVRHNWVNESVFGNI